MKQWKPIFMQVSEAIQKRTYVGSIGQMVSKVQKWMLKNGLDPKRQTRGHKTVDFPGPESGSTSINEVSRDNAGRLVRAIKLRNLDSKGPFSDRSDEESAPAMCAWFYYHKTLALAPRAKHSITVPTVSYAIDMLQLLQGKQQKTTNLDPDTTKTKNATQNTRKIEESNQQKPYKKIKMIHKRKNNTKQTNIAPQEHPKQKYRREKRLRNAQRSKNGRRTAKEMIEKGKQEEKKKQINK